MQTPKLEDVARHAGVSTATVSRVLNSPLRVSERTRLKVEKSVAELGYTPNFIGRALASNRTNTIGAIIPTMENSIFAHAIQALEETLFSQGVTLLIATSQYSKQREEDQLRVLVSRGVDGIVLVGADRSQNIYDLLRARAIPYVVMWMSSQDKQHVTIGFNNEVAAHSVVHRVYDAGHRRIAMLAGITEGNDRAAQRVVGARRACQELGLPPLNVVETAYTLEAGKKAALSLLSGPDRPTAVICGNDVIAAGTIAAAAETELNVPRDVSVTGFDDTDLASILSPPLTTMRIPHLRMGRAAGEVVMSWINSGERPENIEYETKWVERGSLAPPVNVDTVS